MRFPSRSCSESGGSSRRAFCRGLLLAAGWLAACGRDRTPPATAAGRPLPALSLPGLDGGSQALAGPCIVNFWATWCPPCRAEMASLNRLHRDFAGRGLVVLGVSVDTDLNLVREYQRSQALDFAILLDPGARLAKVEFAVAAFPTSWLVDRDGRCREVWIGERDWDAPATRAAVTALLAA